MLPSHSGVMILAAGASSRLGSPKQLVDYRNKPLLQHMIDLVSGLDFSGKTLVVGANETAILEAVDPGKLGVVRNQNWQEGMASSIRAGLSEILRIDPNAKQVLVLLSDQPLVNLELVLDLFHAHAAGPHSLTASYYRGMAGVPALFSRVYFDELFSLQGDRGARQILNQYPERVNRVPFAQGELDIDTPQDLIRLRNLEE